ncbi:interaptin-like isoform X2 [Dreissena polymorpha]|uniref:SAM-dependent MTase TRM10-type domain-containing protein n=2 Tax=Dreissena polymorpha TaxID=45954 RepID=A0A9D4LJ84_DREPO|nr:interaptin-like isoform X2 [Dreissena polymorpha]KAH3858417.1 hypothetical protein DPMN_101041 [Dreissena polymorpha]
MLRIGRILNCVLERQGDTSLVRIIPCCLQKRNLSQKKKIGQLRQEKAREFLDNMDTAMVEKKARMERWIEEMRHLNYNVPKVISEYDWKMILIQADSRSHLEKFCKYLFLRECSKENDEVKREKLQKEREEKLQELVGSYHKFSIPYWKRDANTEMWARLRGMRYGDPIIMDMGFPDLKIREMREAFVQFNEVIAENKSHPQPFHLHVTSVRDNRVFSEILDSIDCQGTMVNFHEKPFWEIFPKEDLVYLTPDGPKLQGVNRNDIFVIGGIVDLHDTYPRTFIRAKELGIRMGSIPIHDYRLLVNSPKLRLPLPHIFGIMQDYCLNHDWELAFSKYLSPNKFLPKNEEGLRKKIEMMKSSKYQQGRSVREYERELMELTVRKSVRGKSMAPSVDTKYSKGKSDWSNDVRLSGRSADHTFGYKRENESASFSDKSDNRLSSGKFVRNGQKFGDRRHFDEFCGIENASNGLDQMTRNEFSKKKRLQFHESLGNYQKEITRDEVVSVDAKDSSSKSYKSNDSDHARKLYGHVREFDLEESIGKNIGSESVRNVYVSEDEQNSANHSDMSDDNDSNKLSNKLNQAIEERGFDMNEFLGQKGLKEISREGLMTADLKYSARNNRKSDDSFDSSLLSSFGNASGEQQKGEFHSDEFEGLSESRKKFENQMEKDSVSKSEDIGDSLGSGQSFGSDEYDGKMKLSEQFLKRARAKNSGKFQQLQENDRKQSKQEWMEEMKNLKW